MYITTILYFLFLIHNNPNINHFVSEQIESHYNKITNMNDGKDLRYHDNAYDETVNMILLYKIKKNYIIKNLLEELEKNTTNIYNKLELLEKYAFLYSNQTCITSVDLFAGNLLDNFYCDNYE
jgi:hypothetical protein